MKRKPWEPPYHAKCFCAAVATAVAGVAAAGTAAYSAYSQNSAQKKAQSTLEGNQAEAYGSKVNPVKYEDHVNLPEFDSQQGVSDYVSSLPMLSRIAHTDTVRAQRLRDQISGGQSSANLQSAGGQINRLIAGEVPKDVQDNINRMVASRTGGAFSPNGQQNQVAAADYARKIGMTSTQMMQMGLQANNQWESLVDSFTYKPQQAFTDALNALRVRDDYVQGAAKIQLQRDENAYTGQVNYEKMKAMPNPQISGFTNDNLALNTAESQSNQNLINGLLGMVKSGAAAYTAIQGSSDPYNNAGFIKPDQVGNVASSYATPGYTPNFGYGSGGAYFTGYSGSGPA